MIRTASAVGRRARIRRSTLLSFLAVMGPGIITGFAGNDAGGVTTYTAVGAHYGFAMLWLLLLSTAGLLVIQEMCARMGAVTGKGLSDLIRESLAVYLEASISPSPQLEAALTRRGNNPTLTQEELALLPAQAALIRSYLTH